MEHAATRPPHPPYPTLIPRRGQDFNIDAAGTVTSTLDQLTIPYTSIFDDPHIGRTDIIFTTAELSSFALWIFPLWVWPGYCPGIHQDITISRCILCFKMYSIFQSSLVYFPLPRLTWALLVRSGTDLIIYTFACNFRVNGRLDYIKKAIYVHETSG